MVSVNTDRLVDDYLRRLEAAAAGLAPDDRAELVAEIREHIDSALHAAGSPDEVIVRNVLERLGPPEEIAGAADPIVEDGDRDHPVGGGDIAGLVVLTAGFLVPLLGLLMRHVALGPWEVASLAAWGFAVFYSAWRLFTRAPRRRRGGGLELAAIILLTVGGFTWLGFSWLAGYALVWLSHMWSKRDKLMVLLVTVVLLPFGWSLTTPAHGVDVQLRETLMFASGVGGMLSGAYLGWRLVGPSRGSAVLDDGRTAPGGGGQAEHRAARRGRRQNWLMGGLVAVVAIGAVIGVALNVRGAGMEENCGPGACHTITVDQFARVGLGASGEEVSQALGGLGERGSLVSGLDPQAVEVQRRTGQEQYDDCWSYSLIGPDVRVGEAAVCFVADKVAYTRLVAD